MIFGFLKGILIGLANIIPGVSGGTIAVILGIFDNLIDAINNFARDIKKNLIFLTPIVSGALFSILFFSSVLKFCLREYSLPTNLFFAGLVFGSIPLIYKKATKNNFNAYHFVYTVVATVFVIFISNVNINNIFEIGENFSLILITKIFFGAILAAIAMIIPGISGSFIMVLLGIYPTIINAISNIPQCVLNFSNKTLLINTGATISSFALGILLGIIFASKLISGLLEKFYTSAYFCILGLVIGSIYGIFTSPMTYQSGINNFMILIGIVTFFMGTIISYFLGDKN